MWYKRNASTSSAYLRKQVALPSEYWLQFDVWVANSTLTACDGVHFGEILDLLQLGYSGRSEALFAVRVGGVWKWQTSFNPGGAAGTLTANTTTTIKVHVNGTTLSWFANGSLLFTYTRTTARDGFELGDSFAESCLCDIYFYTNVKAGTTDGGSNLFADDFSSGNFSAWTNVVGPAFIVAAPSQCVPPTITLTPTRGCQKAAVIATGAGLNPGDAITATFNGVPIPIGTPHVAGDGTFVISFAVPLVAAGPGRTYDVDVTDQSGTTVVAVFTVCCPIHSDAIDTTQGPFLGPELGPGSVLLDYAFCAGGHWVMWQNPQPSWVGSAAPATNPTIGVARVDDATGAVTSYTVDTAIAWSFNSGASTFLGGPGGNWQDAIFFSDFTKPVLDAKFANDGTTLWIAVLTKKTVLYPYITSDDGHGYPSQTSQFVDLATLTSGFSFFSRSTGQSQALGGAWERIHHDSNGTLNIYAPVFPNSDSGDNWFGYWNVPNIVVFAGGAGGFAKIGESQAMYYPGVVTAADNDGAIVGGGPPRFNAVGDAGSAIGAILTGLAVCASEAEPGVLHLVWGEGGIQGRYGAGAVGGTTPTVWDGGPANLDYRMNYQRWSPGGQILDADLWHDSYDRTAAWFPFEANRPTTSAVYHCGSWWPPTIPVTSVVALRNDTGSPVMFLAKFLAMPGPTPFGVSTPDPAGNPWLGYTADYTEALMRLYDLSGGGAVETGSFSAALLPTAADVQRGFPGIAASNRLFSPGVTYDGSGANGRWNTADLSPGTRGFGVSFVYDDPVIGPAYIVGVPWATVDYTGARVLNTFTGKTDGFYRIAAEGGAFEFIDGADPAGLRYDYIFCVGNTGDVRPGVENGPDLINDARNLWCPTGWLSKFGGGPLAQLERICLLSWTNAQQSPGFISLPQQSNVFAGSAHYDPATDRISYATVNQVVRMHFCRYCIDCSCGIGPGVHLSKRVTWGG